MSATLKEDSWDEEARRCDADDSLRRFRDRFYRSPGRIYLDGNSLGLLSRDAEAATLQVLAEWREYAIEGWTDAPDPWFTLAETLAAGVAPLLGAEPESVVVTGSTTVNLHQLLATFFDPARVGQNRIVCDRLAFPTDRYALESHLRLRGLDPQTHLITVASRDGITVDADDLIAALTPDVQMAVLPSVVYTSGQLLDIPAISRAARERGILVAWDCSHSIGAVPHDFDDWNVDFAFWCHYKYLNAGPGSVGGLYVNRRHWGAHPGLAGWFGSRKDRQFAMSPEFEPAPSAGGLQIGTPHILSMAPLVGALKIHGEAGRDRIRAKSLALTAFLRRLVESELSGRGFGIATPVADARRGGHLAITHPDAGAISGALRAAGVVPDFRPPDLLRLAPVALYTSFADCLAAVRQLREIVDTGAYRVVQDSGRHVT
jgi:kynureninase